MSGQLRARDAPDDRLLADSARRYGVELDELDLGGGHAIPYDAGAGELDLPGFARRVAIVGRAGVTVYRVGVVKRVGDGRRIVLQPRGTVSGGRGR